MHDMVVSRAAESPSIIDGINPLKWSSSNPINLFIIQVRLSVWSSIQLQC